MGRKRRKGSRDWKSRRRWTAEDAREVLAEADASGQTMRGFAAEHGLDEHRLSRWRRRLAGSVVTERPEFEEVVSSHVEVAQRNDSGDRFEIVLRSGRMVRVGESFDAEALRRLLSVVDEWQRC